MRIAGFKNKSVVLKQSLFRDNKRIIRGRRGDTTHLRNKSLIESFTRLDFEEYEKWMHKWGTPGRKRQIMLDQMRSRAVTGPVIELAKLRIQNLLEHQKILQVLRNMWYNYQELETKQVNSNSDLFWKGVALRIRGRKVDVAIEPIWLGQDGKLKLVEYLRTLYENQSGLCALSKEQMLLEKKNLQQCSPDRIDSDKGYVIGNIQLTCLWVNLMKSDYSTREFNRKIRILAERL